MNISAAMKVGWQSKTIGEVCDVVNGGTPKTGVATYWDGPHQWITPAEMGKRSSPYIGETERTITDDGLQNSSARLLPPYSVILSSRAPIGHLVINTEFKELSGGKLKEVPVPVPSLPDQQRIVAILDEAFEGIATTVKANAEKNLQNARAISESHLQAVLTQGGEGWVETTIGPKVRFIDYRGKTPVKTESGIRLITAKNVKMGFLQAAPMEFIASDGYEAWMTRGIPHKGDVLFTTEGPLANVTQLDTDGKVAFAQRIIIMQPDESTLDSTFLKYLLLSQPIQQRIHAKGTGATVKGIKASLLKTIKIAFPKLVAEQVELVATLDSLSEESSCLESLYQQKLAALDDLKKPLLHQAFSGQL